MDPKQPNKAPTAPAPESVVTQLQISLSRFRAAARNEALLSIALGLVLIPLVYVVVFYLLLNGVAYFFGFLFFLGGLFGGGRLLLGGIWFIIAAGSAWTQVSPMSAPLVPPGKSYDRFLDPPLVRDAAPEPNLASLDYITHICGSGPRNVFEGIAMLRAIPSASAADCARAAQILVRAASSEGLTAQGFVRDDATARAMALLWRLKLITKETGYAANWRIRATTRGNALVR